MTYTLSDILYTLKYTLTDFEVTTLELIEADHAILLRCKIFHTIDKYILNQE